MVRRLLAVLLVMALCVIYAPAGVAHAYSVPWVPPSWGTGSAPTWLGGTAVGGAGWGLEPTGAGYGRDCTAIPNKIGRLSDFAGLPSTFPGGAVNLVVRYLVVGECPNQGMTETGNYTNPTLQAKCNGTSFQAATGRGSVASGSYYYAGYVSCALGVEADVTIAPRGAVAPSAAYWQPAAGRIGGTQVLRLMCSNGDGVQVVTGEAGSSDVNVSCPAGYSVIGGSLEVGGTVVSQVTAPVDVTPAQQHAVSTGAGRAVIESGGYSCDPTMALGSPIEWCRRYGSDGTAPETAICKFTFDDVSLSMITLTKADCASWREVIGGGSAPTDPSEDSDTNLIVEWLQRIKAAVDAVKGAVVQTGQSIVQAIEDLGEKIDGLDGGSGGGPGVGPGPGAAPGPSGDADGLTGKFGPWLDLWGSMTGAGFGSSASDCRGPAMELQLGGTTHTWYLLDACGARAELAVVSRVVLSVVLVWATIMATIRVLASALGLQLKMGE